MPGTVEAIKSKDSVSTGPNILRETVSKEQTCHVLNGDKCLKENRN